MDEVYTQRLGRVLDFIPFSLRLCNPGDLSSLYIVIIVVFFFTD
jgi:hypothetical protein